MKNKIISILCNTIKQYYYDSANSITSTKLTDWYCRDLFLKIAFVKLDYDLTTKRYFLYAMNPMELLNNNILWNKVRDNIENIIGVTISIGKYNLNCNYENTESYFIYDEINEYFK